MSVTYTQPGMISRPVSLNGKVLAPTALRPSLRDILGVLFPPDAQAIVRHFNGKRLEVVCGAVEALTCSYVKLPFMTRANEYTTDYLAVRERPLSVRTPVVKCPNSFPGSNYNDGYACVLQAHRLFLRDFC